MTPSPSVWHQKVAKRLVNLLCSYVEASGLGEVFMAPLDVELGYGYIVQPDVFVLLKSRRVYLLPLSKFSSKDVSVVN